MWGVPKRRRSVERRLTRRFGLKEWHWKMLIPKYNLLICDNCGHHYQAKHMCSKSKFLTFSRISTEFIMPAIILNYPIFLITFRELL